jgi:GAF domain-containing protein
MNASERPQPNEVERFRRDVLRAALVDLTSKGLVYVSGALVALFLLLVVSGGSVPAWLLAVVALLAALIVLQSQRQVRRLRGQIAHLDTQIAELKPFEQNAPELEDMVDSFSWALERFEVYTAHVAEVLDHLQLVLSGNIDVPIPIYIERGILEPARDVLANDPDEHIRLSVLLPDEDCFVMAWSAGHTLPGRSKYRVPIKDTLSHLAYESGEPQAWKDVTEDDRFKQNPKASHPTRSMVSIPLRRGEVVIGVFNVIASEPAVFDPAETRYLASLGSIISVAVSVLLEREGGHATEPA